MNGFNLIKTLQWFRNGRWSRSEKSPSLLITRWTNPGRDARSPSGKAHLTCFSVPPENLLRSSLPSLSQRRGPTLWERGRGQMERPRGRIWPLTGFYQLDARWDFHGKKVCAYALWWKGEGQGCHIKYRNPSSIWVSDKRQVIFLVPLSPMQYLIHTYTKNLFVYLQYNFFFF